MVSKFLSLSLMMAFTVITLTACGISADVHNLVVAEKEAAQASVAQLEKDKAAAQASTAQLEKDKEIIQSYLTKAEETVQNLNAVHPPRRFKDRNEIEAWLSNDDISQRGPSSSAEGLLSKALELQARALEDGFIVSADYYGPDEDYKFEVWNSAVTEDSDYFAWNPESDEVYFVSNINLL